MQLLSAGRVWPCGSPGLAWLTLPCNGDKHGQDNKYSQHHEKVGFPKCILAVH